MKEDEKKDRIDKLWQHGLHEDSVFNERLNFFLVFETVLLGVVGMLFGSANSTEGIIKLFVTLGFVLTLMWMYVQARQKSVVEGLRQTLRELDKGYDEAITQRDSKRWPISSTWLLTYFIPLSVLLIWGALFFVQP